MAARRAVLVLLRRSIKQEAFHSINTVPTTLLRRTFFFSATNPTVLLCGESNLQFGTAQRVSCFHYLSSLFSSSPVSESNLSSREEYHLIGSPNWETETETDTEPSQRRNSHLDQQVFVCPNPIATVSNPESSDETASEGFLEPTDVYIPVKAFFISRRINLKALQEEQFLETTSSRNHLILKWKDRPSGCPPLTGKLDMQQMGTWSSTRYIVVFNYGAVVLFNFGENEEGDCMDVIRQHCSETCQEARNDDFDIVVRPTLERWCQGGQDKVFLKKLNLDNMRIVASILGQSIALDHYGRLMH